MKKEKWRERKREKGRKRGKEKGEMDNGRGRQWESKKYWMREREIKFKRRGGGVL